jgi:HlyD family secretion protein
MTPAKRIVAAAVLVSAAAAGTYYFFRTSSDVRTYQGWVEAQLIFVSPDEAGRVEVLSVREGDPVEAGAHLFTLDSDLQRAAVAENEAMVANARLTYDRAKELLKRAVGSQKTADDAESNLRTAEAKLNSARTKLERRKVASPVTGSIQEIYFRQGETVQAGRPIVSMLPPGNVRVRFFVPQATLPTLKIGDRITVACDGCTKGLAARVNFISAQAEFTPPVIYSEDERSRLVFRIEATPESPQDFRVGQPVSVALQDAGERHARR